MTRVSLHISLCLEDRILISWKSYKSEKLKLSIFMIKQREWVTISMQQIPDFRLGSGNAIFQIASKIDEPKNDDQDQIKETQKETENAPTQLLILGGKL